MIHGLSYMWDPPGPGIEPMSFALAGRFLSTVLPGKLHLMCFVHHLEKPMDRVAWQATVHGISRGGHDLALSFLSLTSIPVVSSVDSLWILGAQSRSK